MSNSSSNNTVIVVALIGALGSVGAAVVGLLPWLTAKPDAAATPPAVVKREDPTRDRDADKERDKAKAKKPPAPVSLSYRKSKVPGAGLVLELKNTDPKQALEGLTVVATTAGKPERTFTSNKPLKPGDKLEVGPDDLKGILRRDDTVRVRANGFADVVDLITSGG